VGESSRGDEKTLNRVLRWSLVLLVLALAVGCDQATKRLARQSLADAPPLSFLAGALRLEYAENAGGFLSLGAELPDRVRFFLFIPLVGVILAGSLALAPRSTSGLQLWGLSLLAGGGAGNLIDRIAHDGRVVDFINLGLGPLRTGVFNLADVAVTTGVVLLAFSGLRPADRSV
jgi:signal peptidase II